MKITVMKEVSNREVAMNFISNLVTRAGGDVAYKVNLILTYDSLYLEHIGHAAIGYGEERREVYKIPLKDLSEFSVLNKEGREEIKIKGPKEEFNFFRDNKKGEDLALSMRKVLKELKEGDL